MRKLAVISIKWSFFQQFFTISINYLSIIVLAALIAPAVHGFITIASIPVGFTAFLGSFGVREKIVKEREISDEYKQCLLGFIIVLSILLFLLSLILVLGIAYFYQSNFSFYNILKYGSMISLIAPVGVFNHYFESFQTRDLNFKVLSIINIIAMILGVFISILFAYYGYDYFSLSLKLILPNFFLLILYLVYFKPSLKVKWCSNFYISFKSFSTYLTLNNIANYFVRNVDYLVIGKMFSADILGQYSIAYKVLLFPMRTITSRIQNVMMPLLSKLDYNSNDFKKKYFMIIGFLAFVTFPVMGILGATANIWVPITFNEKYNLLVPMIMIFSVVGAFQSLVSPVGALYLFNEKTKLMFRNSLINASIITLVFAISSFFGNIFWVLIAYALAWLVLIMPISMYSIFKSYKIEISRFFVTIGPAFISIIFALACVFLLNQYLFFNSSIINFISSCVFILIIYIGVYYYVNKKDENRIKNYYNIIFRK